MFTFKVYVMEMTESHRKTWWVTIDRSDRDPDAFFDDDTRITPYKTEIKFQAEYECAVWDAFLNGKPQPNIMDFGPE